MKYIEIYLNEKQKELEQLKQKEIDEFRDRYRKCENNNDYELLIEDTYYSYYTSIDDYNTRLKEIENLRNDLIPKEDKKAKGE